MGNKPWTVAVLLGGVSAERPVSIKSGHAVSAALKKAGLDVIEVDVKGDIEKLLDDTQSRCDAAFIALHGTFGEDGGIQRMLEARAIPYTGSGPEASKAAMDKQISKALFSEAEVPTPAGIVLSEPFEPEAAKDLARTMGFPVVVKPVAQGSSKGVHIVRTEAEILPAMADAASFDDRVIVESFLPNAEFAVGILDDEPLPVIEIRYPCDTFDYEAKYISNETEYILDPPVGGELEREMQRIAVKAHNILGCKHFSRVDLRLDAENGPCVLEVNTIPGLTSHSLLPKAAAAAGISFVDLCKRMLASTSARTDSMSMHRAVAPSTGGR